MILLFWSSFNNIEKIQKLSDNKTVILHWTTMDKTNNYSMNLSFENRNEFLNDLMERVKNFGMNFDIFKMNNQNQVEHQKFTSDFKLKKIEKEKENINTKNLGEEKLDEDEDSKKKEDNKKENLEEKNEDLNKNININEIGNKI